MSSHSSRISPPLPKCPESPLPRVEAAAGAMLVDVFDAHEVYLLTDDVTHFVFDVDTGRPRVSAGE